jgi:dTDP-4-amino-4,6-dideoxygalactose transaminase
MINVTKTYLPEKKKYISYIDRIYQNGWITNNGPLVQELEHRLLEYLNIKNIILVANGTIALEMAYRLLKLKGEAITTPFSFVATTSSLVSNGLKPVFTDIDPSTFNLDPKKIEEQITDKTGVIVPTHIFGNVCEIEKIDKIANKHNLKVIYDAAHAFAIKYKGKSVLNHGNISTLSFHATKLFHTTEGGALIINDDTMAEEARLLINFGIDKPDSVVSLGTNAKMNEFEAAMGLCILDDIDRIIDQRKEVFERYENGLKDVLAFQKQNENSTQNYNFFPVLFKTEEQMLKVKTVMNNAKIYPRRYFYPSLDTLPYIKDAPRMNISRKISSQILALPIYSTLGQKDQMKIINIIRDNCGQS